MQLRYGKRKDHKVLRELFFEAIFWDPQKGRPDIDDFFKANPELLKFISDWGRTGDHIIIAEDNNKILGAAWCRLWTEEDHSYGYVHPEIPELGIALFPQFRSKGYGRVLIRALIQWARRKKFKGVSLSVSPDNYALQLYQSEGFYKIGESGTSWTLLLNL